MLRLCRLGLGLCVFVWSWASPDIAVANSGCYMAFVHGSGDNFHDEDPATSPAIARYWSSDGSDWASFAYYAARQWAGAEGCVVWKVGYDGNQQWWSDRAAGKVAASLHDFIERYDIPDGRLILVGHSMGGLVVRYVVNNGMPGAPFYNEYSWLNARMDYDLVRRKTGQIFAVQAPHTGAQASDALFGHADHRLTNTGADVIKLLGWREATNATGVMTRSYMEAAGAPGGEMGDEGRQVVMYTIAGIETGDGSGTGMDADGKLDLAWVLLCYKRGAANSWGAGCRWDVWNFSSTPGDGLVEKTSSHGLWMRGQGSGATAIYGARQPWLDVVHNHNHGRFDVHYARIVDHVRGTSSDYYLGSYVGGYPPPL